MSGCSSSGKKYELVVYNIVKKCKLNGILFNTQFENELGGCISKNDIECNMKTTRDISIEIKKSKLQKVHYHQIIRYYDIIKLKFPDYFVNGFLIGHKNSRESNLNKSEWLSIKYLDEDIPSKIKICKSCRKPISYISYECNFCFQRF